METENPGDQHKTFNLAILKNYNMVRKRLQIKMLPEYQKVPLVKAMVFPVVMYGYESWTVKKAECRRIDAFELWC